MKNFLVIILIAISLNTFAQKESGFKSDRRRSFAQIKELKEDGALVLRLTLHKKKADLYRKAGQHKVADKIEKDLREKNELLALTLLDESFDFCKVYIIESLNYGKVINGEKSGYFLDKNLKVDSSIVLNEENVYFMEVGNVYEVVRKEDSFLESEVSSTPIIQNALVIKDKNMEQLMKPFPFNVPLDGIFLDISNFIVYNKGKSANGLMFTDMESYNNYMRRKYNLSKKDVFTVQKIFNLNLRLFGFYSSAKKAEFDAITKE